MEVSGDYLFEAPQEMVWKALLDPNVLGSIMPGGQEFQQVAENEFKGGLKIQVGPVQGNFQGQIKLSDINPPESYHIEVDGKGAPGFVKGVGSLKLEPRDQHTFMQYSGQAQVGGRIASVGQRLLDSSARSIIRQSLEALNEYLKVQVAQQAPQPVAAPAASAPPEVVPATDTAQAPVMPAAPATPSVPASAAPAVPTYKPPSQMQLALNVARDVFNDMVPAQYQPVVIGGVALVILLLIWLVIRR